MAGVLVCWSSLLSVAWNHLLSVAGDNLLSMVIKIMVCVPATSENVIAGVRLVMMLYRSLCWCVAVCYDARVRSLHLANTMMQRAKDVINTQRN